MYGLLLALLVLDGLFLSVVILLQAGKGGGLAAMGGGAAATDGILAGRQASAFLTRATWASGTAFMVLALVLSIMSSRTQQPESILTTPDAPATAPQPLLPGEGATGGQGGEQGAPEPVLPGGGSGTGSGSSETGGGGEGGL